MKIKTIKKLNILLIVFLLSITIGLGSMELFVRMENGQVDASRLAGKASEAVIEGNEALAGINEAITIPGSEEAEITNSESAASQNIEQPKTMINETGSALDGQNKFSFVAIGDTESFKDNSGYNPELVDVLVASKKYNPDFALFTGDILSASGTSDVENKNRISNLRAVIQQHYNNYYISFGKHDIECGKVCIDSWLETFFGIKPSSDGERWLYHSFDYLNTHFVLLSTDHPDKHSIDNTQLEWLEGDLSKNKKPNTIVVQHVPPVSFFEDSAKDCHDMSCNDQVRQKLLSIFKKYNVDLVISGHENAFDHKIVDGIDFVLSGQAGSEPKYKNVIKGDIYTFFAVDGEQINVEGINTKGEVIRSIKIK